MSNGRKSNLPKRVKSDDKAQSKLFIEKARELGCDENEKAFDAALKKIAAAKPADRKGKAQKA